MSRVVLSLGRTLVLLAFVGTGCVTPVGVSGDVAVDVGPPPDVLATLTPVYYNGVPAYWWGGQWYYRNGGSWSYYRTEPGYLHDYRARVVPGRTYPGRAYYGRPRVVAGRPAHR
jgi:hypothetical protein